METTERIVEAYARYIRKWATIPNIKCGKQQEIDLIAIDPVTLDRYHIETSISTASGFSKLTAVPFDEKLAKVRVQAPAQRRTIGFFEQRKFSSQPVVDKLREYGFKKGRYEKVIVTWDAKPEAEVEAARLRIRIWKFPELLREISKAIRKSTTYYADDTLRTLHLFMKAYK